MPSANIAPIKQLIFAMIGKTGTFTGVEYLNSFSGISWQLINVGNQVIITFSSVAMPNSLFVSITTNFSRLSSDPDGYGQVQMFNVISTTQILFDIGLILNDTTANVADIDVTQFLNTIKYYQYA